MHILVVTALDIQNIRELIGDRLGWSFAAVKYHRLKATLKLELAHFHLECIGDYLALLRDATLETEIWQRLIHALANPESYFFRDQHQFDLLRHQILPELIQRRSPAKQLTIWSAGCATGEEVYSLAMVLLELIPDIENWDISIVGTDINTEALVIAEVGEYREWSWRLPDTQLKDKYCQRVGPRRYRMKDNVRRLVKFIPANLLADLASSEIPDIHLVDLILCRHVFIHLEAQAIAKVLQNFQRVLSINGYLMTGHGELYGTPLQNFQTKVYAGSLVYQRDSQPQPKVALFSLPSLNLKSQRRSPSLPKRQLKLSDPMFACEAVIPNPMGRVLK